MKIQTVLQIMVVLLVVAVASTIFLAGAQKDLAQSQVSRLSAAYQEHLVAEYAKEKCGIDLNKRPIDNAQQQGCFESVRQRAKREVEAVGKQ